MSISAQSAKAFAQSARTIAYLEGEVTRVKTLADHFRVVNDKLMGDLKLSREESMTLKSVEHRLKLSIDAEKRLQEKLKVSEAMLKNKERETLLTIQQARDNEDSHYSEVSRVDRIEEVERSILCCITGVE